MKHTKSYLPRSVTGRCRNFPSCIVWSASTSVVSKLAHSGLGVITCKTPRKLSSTLLLRLLHPCLTHILAYTHLLPDRKRGKSWAMDSHIPCPKWLFQGIDFVQQLSSRHPWSWNHSYNIATVNNWMSTKIQIVAEGDFTSSLKVSKPSVPGHKIIDTGDKCNF